MTEPLLDVNSPSAQQRWGSIAMEARRRRLGIEIRDGSSDLPYAVVGKERSELEEAVGSYATLDQAFTVAEKWVLDRPIPGPTALRDELRDHGRKLAVLTPRQLGGKGGDFPLYRRFRDRILPLAWDNLVDSIRLEALEEFVRKVGTLDADILAVPLHNEEQLRLAADLAAEARGLVAPKEEG